MKKFVILLCVCLISAIEASGEVGPILPTLESFFSVIDIDNNDTLNIRSGPGTEFKIIGELAYNANSIRLLSCTKSSKGGIWCKLEYPLKNLNGWVSKRYLTSKNIFIHDKNSDFEYNLIPSNLKSGRGNSFKTVYKIDSKRFFTVESCQKNIYNENWCWIYYYNNKLKISNYAWINKKNLLKKQNCHNAILEQNIKKIQKYCSREIAYFEKNKKYSQVILDSLFIQDFKKIIKYYEDKKILNNPIENYLIIAYAYKKLNKNQKYNKIINNICLENNLKKSLKEYKKVFKTYTFIYPNEKKIINKIKCNIDILPVVPTNAYKKEFKKCMNFINSRNSFSKKELYKRCKNALELYYSNTPFDILKADKLTTIAILLDNIEPEKRFFYNYIDNSYYSDMYRGWLLGEYYYFNNLPQKINFFKNYFTIFLFLPYNYFNKYDTQLRFENQFDFFYTLITKLKPQSSSSLEFISEIDKIKKIFEDYQKLVLCYYTSIKKSKSDII